MSQLKTFPLAVLICCLCTIVFVLHYAEWRPTIIKTYICDWMPSSDEQQQPGSTARVPDYLKIPGFNKTFGEDSEEDERLLKHLRNTVLWPPSSKPYNLLRKNVQENSEGSFITKHVIPKYFPTLEGGVFFEAGGLDGETLSTTLYLERFKNWTGMLAEMNPLGIDRIVQKNRKSWLAPACLSPTNTPSRVCVKICIYEVPCYPVTALLLAANLDSIDFFSLDVEGLELKVLKTIDFQRIKIKVIHMDLLHTEEGEPAVHDFLKTKGFKHVHGRELLSSEATEEGVIQERITKGEVTHAMASLPPCIDKHPTLVMANNEARVIIKQVPRLETCEKVENRDDISDAMSYGLGCDKNKIINKAASLKSSRGSSKTFSARTSKRSSLAGSKKVSRKSSDKSLDSGSSTKLPKGKSSRNSRGSSQRSRKSSRATPARGSKISSIHESPVLGSAQGLISHGAKKVDELASAMKGEIEDVPCKLAEKTENAKSLIDNTTEGIMKQSKEAVMQGQSVVEGAGNSVHAGAMNVLQGAKGAFDPEDKLASEASKSKGSRSSNDHHKRAGCDEYDPTAFIAKMSAGADDPKSDDEHQDDSKKLQPKTRELNLSAPEMEQRTIYDALVNDDQEKKLAQKPSGEGVPDMHTPSESMSSVAAAPKDITAGVKAPHPGNPTIDHLFTTTNNSNKKRSSKKASHHGSMPKDAPPRNDADDFHESSQNKTPKNPPDVIASSQNSNSAGESSSTSSMQLPADIRGDTSTFKKTKRQTEAEPYMNPGGTIVTYGNKDGHKDKRKRVVRKPKVKASDQEAFERPVPAPSNSWAESPYEDVGPPPVELTPEQIEQIQLYQAAQQNQDHEFIEHNFPELGEQPEQNDNLALDVPSTVPQNQPNARVQRKSSKSKSPHRRASHDRAGADSNKKPKHGKKPRVSASDNDEDELDDMDVSSKSMAADILKSLYDGAANLVEAAKESTAQIMTSTEARVSDTIETAEETAAAARTKAADAATTIQKKAKKTTESVQEMTTGMKDGIYNAGATAANIITTAKDTAAHATQKVIPNNDPQEEATTTTTSQPQKEKRKSSKGRRSGAGQDQSPRPKAGADPDPLSDKTRRQKKSQHHSKEDTRRLAEEPQSEPMSERRDDKHQERVHGEHDLRNKEPTTRQTPDIIHHNKSKEGNIDHAPDLRGQAKETANEIARSVRKASNPDHEEKHDRAGEDPQEIPYKIAEKAQKLSTEVMHKVSSKTDDTVQKIVTKVETLKKEAVDMVHDTIKKDEHAEKKPSGTEDFHKRAGADSEPIDDHIQRAKNTAEAARDELRNHVNKNAEKASDMIHVAKSDVNEKAQNLKDKTKKLIQEIKPEDEKKKPSEGSRSEAGEDGHRSKPLSNQMSHPKNSAQAAKGTSLATAAENANNPLHNAEKLQDTVINLGSHEKSPGENDHHQRAGEDKPVKDHAQKKHKNDEIHSEPMSETKDKKHHEQRAHAKHDSHHRDTHERQTPDLMHHSKEKSHDGNDKIAPDLEGHAKDIAADIVKSVKKASDPDHEDHDEHRRAGEDPSSHSIAKIVDQEKQSTKEKATDLMHKVKDKAEDAAHKVGSKLGEVREKGIDVVHDAAKNVEKETKDSKNKHRTGAGADNEDKKENEEKRPSSSGSKTRHLHHKARTLEQPSPKDFTQHAIQQDQKSNDIDIHSSHDDQGIFEKAAGIASDAIHAVQNFATHASTDTADAINSQKDNLKQTAEDVQKGVKDNLSSINNSVDSALKKSEDAKQTAQEIKQHLTETVQSKVEKVEAIAKEELDAAKDLVKPKRRDSVKNIVEDAVAEKSMTASEWLSEKAENIVEAVHHAEEVVKDQLGQCLVRYLTMPTLTSVTWKNYEAEDTPAITICAMPSFHPDKWTTFFDQYSGGQELINKPYVSAPQMYNLAKINASYLDEFFRFVAMPVVAQVTYCAFGATDNECKPYPGAKGLFYNWESGNSSLIDTPSGKWITRMIEENIGPFDDNIGKCSTLVGRNLTLKHGLHNRIIIDLDSGIRRPPLYNYRSGSWNEWLTKSDWLTTSWSLYIHEVKEAVGSYALVNEIERLKINFDTITDVTFTTEKYVTLSKDDQLCNDDPSYRFKQPRECNMKDTRDDIDYGLVKASLFTRNGSRAFQDAMDNCCAKPCTYYSYVYKKASEMRMLGVRPAEDSYKAKIRIGIGDSRVKVVEEHLAYEMAQFLGELGGIWGLFLGASVVNVLALLYAFFLQTAHTKLSTAEGRKA
ncbi:unnamed protein product [Notodromas monacha]|uniref:Methyltransferase FkbM domain-containing protein n=1 Tax=Notodromas monacha TaxID=399045 RepID=A0A7R9GBQ6_9CRUS|nr:unnamed protein product [Notodromas monacha]CAG0915056.1 unnamed protein product [Notodromas monacha]